MMNTHHKESYTRNTHSCTLKIIENKDGFHSLVRFDTHTLLIPIFESLFEDTEVDKQYGGKYRSCDCCKQKATCTKFFGYSNRRNSNTLQKQLNQAPHLRQILLCKPCLQEIRDRTAAWVDDHPEQIIKYI